jgi:hypothetical protein
VPTAQQPSHQQEVKRSVTAEHPASVHGYDHTSLHPSREAPRSVLWLLCRTWLDDPDIAAAVNAGLHPSAVAQGSQGLLSLASSCFWQGLHRALLMPQATSSVSAQARVRTSNMAVAHVREGFLGHSDDVVALV